MSASGVRCEKAALSSGCKSHTANAPAGSNRSSHGGNEVAEAWKPSQTSERTSQSMYHGASYAECSPGLVGIDRALSRSANSASRRRRGPVKLRCGSSIWICPRGKLACRHFEAGQKFDVALLAFGD